VICNSYYSANLYVLVYDRIRPVVVTAGRAFMIYTGHDVRCHDD